MLHDSLHWLHVPPRRLKEVVYTLGTYNQKVMSGLWADLPYKISKKVNENWVSTLCLLGPVIGTYQCVGPPSNPPRAWVRASCASVELCQMLRAVRCHSVRQRLPP